MAVKGYATSAQVEAHLGQTLTAAQRIQAERLIERAEVFFDSQTNRAWLTGTQTQEAHFAPAELLVLDYFPIDSVTTVVGRTDIGESETTLVADQDYEIRDASAGILWLESPYSYDRIRVTYVPSDTVPADVTEAIIEIVAARLQPSLRPGSFGLDSYSLPDLTVRFARSHVQQMVPPFAQQVIDKYYMPVAG